MLASRVTPVCHQQQHQQSPGLGPRAEGNSMQPGQVARGATGKLLLVVALLMGSAALTSAQTGLRKADDSPTTAAPTATLARPASVTVGGNNVVITTPTNPTAVPAPLTASIESINPTPAPTPPAAAAPAVAPGAQAADAAQITVPVPTPTPSAPVSTPTATPAVTPTAAVNVSSPSYTHGTATYFGDSQVRRRGEGGGEGR